MHKARCQALYVPLPWTGQGFVKIVDVEDDSPFRRGETTEIQEMAVATSLHMYPGVRRSCQVGSHVQRRTPIERERRYSHAPVANRNELGEASLARFDDQANRAGPVARGLPFAVLFARHAVAQCLAGGVTLRTVYVV